MTLLPQSGFLSLNLFVSAAAGITQQLSAQVGSRPPDRPFAADSVAWDCLDRAMQPRIAEARRTLPAARRRVLDGLPAGYRFLVTTRVRDDSGHFEQVFVAVDSIRGDHLLGHLATDVELVQGYRSGQALDVLATEILDWTISGPSGIEEGNYVGRFLDSLQDRLQRSAVPKSC